MWCRYLEIDEKEWVGLEFVFVFMEVKDYILKVILLIFYLSVDYIIKYDVFMFFVFMVGRWCFGVMYFLKIVMDVENFVVFIGFDFVCV